MPRDMTATGRYPPHPRHHPFTFYSAVRLGDPEFLAKIMAVDPYFVTQDNGAGAPLHFATTYRQLDMVHHLLNNGAEVNQRDSRGFTALHRAAYLAHLDGYLELYEYLLSRGADPSIRTEDFDPYLNPGCKLPINLVVEDDSVRSHILALEEKYSTVPKVREPHPDIGDWWALYDYGPEAIQAWPRDYQHPYPELLKRQRDKQHRRQAKQEKLQQRQQFLQQAQGIGAHVQGAAAQAAAAAAAAASITPSDSAVAFLFPGQGAQAVGMIQASKELPAVKQMLATAHAVLGYDLLDVCLNGPKEKLDDTIYSQPALFVANLVALERLRAEDLAAVQRCSATAGLSLGEYAALVFAGALSFEDGLKVVKVRAESMAAAAKQGEPHGMLSVVGMPDTELEALRQQVLQSSGPDTVCQIANYLFPQGRVVSGHIKALNLLAELAQPHALKVQLLAVSGAFHTRLMEPAREKLEKVLAEVTFQEPKVPVYSNVTAAPFGSAAEIPVLLAQQLVFPVQWEATLTGLIRAGKSELFELGPGQQIRAMVRRMDQTAWKVLRNVAP